jgi:hypothetical protein
MNEILLLLLGIVGIFAIGSSIALIALGKMIDGYPVGDESKRRRSLASPIESTRIAVVIFWALFIVGGWGVIQESRFGLILGITAIFSVCLFMFTAIIFSFAVLGSMKRRRDAIEKTIDPGTPVIPIAAVQSLASVPPAKVSRKKYHQPLSQLMFGAMLKKE